MAQELGISGYIRNMPDGSVDIFAQGDEEKVERFMEAVRSPPPPALVRKIDFVEAKPRPKLRFFKIRYGSVTEELQEGFGSMERVFYSYWDEFRDYREEFRDYRKEFRDYREEFRDYREEFRRFSERTDENFRKLMEKYGEISDRLAQILNILLEESRRSKEMLEAIRAESKETREMLAKALEMLANALQSRGFKP